MYPQTPNLTRVTNDGKTYGVMSRRTYDDPAIAEERERQLFDLATSLMGRQPTVTELHRGGSIHHPQVSRRERPAELRYLDVKVSKATGPQSQEEQLRLELKRLREVSATERMTPRQRLRAEQIKRAESRLAELQEAEERAAFLEQLQSLDGFRRRQRDLDVFRVIAAYDPAAPSYEQLAVDELRRLLDGGEFDRFDRIADPFRDRIESRQADKVEALADVVTPAMASIEAVNSLLS
jgi:hypothetical protein